MIFSTKENKTTFIPFFWLTAIICSWNYATAGSISIKNIGAIVSILIISLLLAQIFQSYFFNEQKQYQYFSFRLLLGILLANLVLFIASLISPFGIVINWAAIGVLTALFLYINKQKISIADVFRVVDKGEYCFLIIAPIVITIWSATLLQAPAVVGEGVEFWVSSDAIGHMALIGHQARGHGIIGMPDLIMSGSQIHPYHFASYQLPALLAALNNILVFPTYAGFLIPVGLLIFGLSAYVIGRYVFGQLAGILCGLGVLLLPDPVQQGFGNLFLGQVSWLISGTPAMPFGIGCAAIAFIFVFEGYKTQKMKWTFLAFMFAGFTLFYKAHLFVAIAWPILVLPILLSEKYTLIVRLIGAALLTALFIACMQLSQLLSTMPTLRLDGSGFETYTHWLVEIQEDGWIRKLITMPYVNEYGRGYLKILVFSTMVLICSIGAVFILYFLLTPFLIGTLRKIARAGKHGGAEKFNLWLWFFPLLVAFIYLVMALGFALEARNIGEGEELQHRPFIWAYFVFSVWAIGGLCYCWTNSQLRYPQWSFYWLTSFAVLLALLIGLHFAPWPSIWKGRAEKITITACLFQASQWIRSHSNASEIIQDSGENLETAALSGRQNFIAKFNRRLPSGYVERQKEFDDFLIENDLKKVQNYLQKNQISWFLARPGDVLPWDNWFNQQKALECGGVRVFHFPIIKAPT